MSEFVGTRPPVRRHLRAALSGEEPVLAPGAYDGLTARLVQRAGFAAVYMTGFGTAAALLGRPDIGLVSQTEMADNARRIVQAVDLPVIADADTGYGNALNVVRTVREYEQAGVAAIQLEDQVFPKRCGHMSGKEVVDTEEAVSKVAAAVAARQDPDLVIIARTDAAAVYGLDAAIERARRYADAGADVLFVEAPPKVADIEAVADRLSGHPILFNWVEGGRTEGISVSRLAELGFRLVIFPISALLAATASVRGVLGALRDESTTEAYDAPMDSLDDFVTTMGLPEIRAVEQSFRH